MPDPVRWNFCEPGQVGNKAALSRNARRRRCSVIRLFLLFRESLFPDHAERGEHQNEQQEQDPCAGEKDTAYPELISQPGGKEGTDQSAERTHACLPSEDTALVFRFRDLQQQDLYDRGKSGSHEYHKEPADDQR